MPEKLERPSLIDLLMERLGDAILKDDGLGPGTPLPAERELAKQYGVNRTSVRHALNKLESLGLITTKHGIGSLVSDYTERGGAELLKYLVARSGRVDVALLDDILEVRAALGGEIARLATQRATDEDRGRLAEHVAALERTSADASAVQLAENAYFRELTLVTGNRALVFLTNSISAAYREHLPRFGHAFADAAEIRVGVRGIQEALVAGEAERAARCARAYLAANGRAMIAGLDDLSLSD